MTKSFGSPSRQPKKPNRPYRDNEQTSGRSPDLKNGGEKEGQFQLNVPTWGPNERSGYIPGSTESNYAPPVAIKVDTSRRMVALFIDVFVCYIAGVAVTLIPFVNRMLPLPLVMAVAFLARDFVFAGRGVGKNLMGFQVVDASTGIPANLIQSFTRNIILIMPFVVLGLVSFLLNFAPLGWLNTVVMQIVNIAGSAYVLIVLPMECYRCFVRPDSLRKGDEIAGTMIIEAPMDFSHFLPKQ
jgi:uncharacterized RDD family membrane protein YckC